MFGRQVVREEDDLHGPHDTDTSALSQPQHSRSHSTRSQRALAHATATSRSPTPTIVEVIVAKRPPPRSPLNRSGRRGTSWSSVSMSSRPSVRTSSRHTRCALSSFTPCSARMEKSEASSRRGSGRRRRLRGPPLGSRVVSVGGAIGVSQCAVRKCTSQTIF